MASTTQTAPTTTIPIVSETHEDATKTLLNELEAHHTKPLWAQMAKLNPPLPNPTAIPHVWKYNEIRPHLLRAGDLITEKQAERRVLMLINPARSMYKFGI
jgi:gentisate 1,2-dioxygenase